MTTSQPSTVGDGLEGLVVLEIASTPGAAFAVSLLADAGATAIVCEPPEGTKLRRLGFGDLDALRWKILARNKQSAAADWAQPENAALLRTLLARADMLVTDTAEPERPRTPWYAPFMDLPEAQRPLLVEVFPSGADRPDLWPWARRPEFAAAAAGLMALSGYEGDEPLQPEVPIADYTAGALAATRALMALRRHRLSGMARKEIGVPLHAALQRMIEWQVPVASATGRAETRMGNNFPMNAGIANMHRTREGKYVAVSAVTQATATRLMAMVGGQELVTDPRFATTESRVQNLPALYPIIDAWMEARSVPELVAITAAQDVVLGPVYDTADIQTDPQIAARGNVLHADPARSLPIMPAPLGRTAATIRNAGPAIGADTDTVLSTLPARAGRPISQPPARPGLRVIELGTVIAGPFAGSLMADLGAEIIKIEPPGAGDSLRLMGRFKGGQPLWFGTSARAKRFVSLNLKHPDGKRLFEQLIAGADVLIENYRPGVLDRLGLNWDNLKRINPRLVMLSISGFGQTGPQSARPGFGRIAEGISGVATLTGAAKGAPLFVGFSLADTSTGLFGVQAIAAALYRRDVMGAGGTRIDFALYEPLLRMLDCQLALHQAQGAPPARRGSKDPYGFGVDSPDRPLFRSVASREELWYFAAIPPQAIACVTSQIAADLGNAETDPLAALKAWCARFPAIDLECRLTELGVELVPVFDGLSIAASPYFAARGDVLPTDPPGIGRTTVPGSVEGGSDDRPLFRAPAVGADNDAVFGAMLGVSPQELDRLKASGVI